MYDDGYHPQVKKDLKKLDKSLRTKIKDTFIPEILSNPLIYSSLSGALVGIRSFHFSDNRVEYRICYLVNEEANSVFFLMISKRENIYKILKRRLK